MKNKTVCLVLSISQSIYAIFLLAWAISVFFTIVLVPEDEYDTEAAPGVFYTILSYPLVLLASALGSWYCYHKLKFKTSYALNAIPLLWVIPMALFMILLWKFGLSS
ncbi:hypothetical protein LOY85_23060 [Brevibacillus brevis]|uniref:hypothetical protein n=1 Tax=Brevibacillus brevis TaxID=1393 RepID=UPI001F34AC66|nr:hypothetical protein [Brevibacillus brevis]UIO41649.1 hypothetical protein LOY85_23060 [Brevibacillus brevis]